MRFYGREAELEQLRSIYQSSKHASTFTVVTGRRRIGKTSLILKSAQNTKYVYLFISKVDQKVLCREMQRTLEEEGIETVGEINRFGDLLKALMLHTSKEHLTVIIDEFQDLKYVDQSIFHDIQTYGTGTRTDLGSI